MPRIAVTVALLLLTVVGVAAAAPVGKLQVTCRPGVRVYLDGDFVGLTTADEDGLFLREVAAGDHVVRVEKLGFESVAFEVEVQRGRATELQIGELTPSQVGVSPTPASSQPAEPPLPSPTATPVPTPAVTAAAEPTVAALPLPPAPAYSPPPGATASTAPAAATVAPPPAAVTVAPVVVTEPAERVAEPTPLATPTPIVEPVAAVPTVVLSSQARPASDVAFAYRASGAAAAEGWSVAIWRERGGPRAPVLVLTCSESAPCEQQTSPRFAPGAYRFRVVFSRTQGEGGKAAVLFRHEVALDLEAKPSTSYLVDALYGGDDPTLCTATVREARFVPGEG